MDITIQPSEQVRSNDNSARREGFVVLHESRKESTFRTLCLHRCRRPTAKADQRFGESVVKEVDTSATSS